MKASVGNEFKELVRAFEQQEAHAAKIERRHKARRVEPGGKHYPTTAPKKARPRRPDPK